VLVILGSRAACLQLTGPHRELQLAVAVKVGIGLERLFTLVFLRVEVAVEGRSQSIGQYCLEIGRMKVSKYERKVEGASVVKR
jgi:hypothetical protein